VFQISHNPPSYFYFILFISKTLRQVNFVLFSPSPPPQAHVRLSLAREPASTELGSGERDVCPPNRVCLCLGALLRCGTARYSYVQFSFYRPRSLAVYGSGAFYLYHRQRDSPEISYSLLDPRPGTTASTAPILDILEIVGRYKYRYNFRPPVVTPLQGSPHRHASSLSMYVYYNFGTSLSPLISL
jgi:hypothetical protein